MRITWFLLAVCFFALAEPVFGQPWRDAYARQDYAAAARLLHAAVLELPAGVHEPDPEAAELLGTLYAEGRGVPRDPVLACAMLRHASISAGITRGPADATTKRVMRVEKAHCATLGYEARLEAGNMVACYAFDVPAETFYLGPAYSVETTRQGLRVLAPDGAGETEIGPTTCNRQVALVRYVPVLVPTPGIPRATRHFFELFHWTSMHRDGRPVRVLTWTLAEVTGAEVRQQEHETLLETDRPVWPPLHPPVSLPNTVFTATADGGVTWRFDEAPRRSGTLAGVAR